MQLFTEDGSPPSRGRGLKQRLGLEVTRKLGVAPLAGARIETTRLVVAVATRWSRPPRGGAD